MATIVSAYYRLPKSKHSYESYKQWVTTFLKYVEGPLVFFTTEEEEPWIQEARGDLPLCVVPMPFEKFPFQTPDWMEFWTRTMEEQDEFKHLHSPEQFVIWNSKTWMVLNAMALNPFQTDKFVWCDAGCWRDERIAKAVGPQWPNPETLCDEMLFLDIRTIEWQREAVRAGTPWIQIDTRNAKENCIGGTIFAGGKKAWQTWAAAYYNTLEEYKARGWFAGDDQSVMMSTDLRLQVSEKTPPRHILAPQRDGYYNGMGDRWFAFQIFFGLNTPVNSPEECTLSS